MNARAGIPRETLCLGGFGPPFSLEMECTRLRSERWRRAHGTLMSAIGAIQKCRPPRSTAAYGSKSDSGKASNSAFINYPTDGKNAIGYAVGTIPWRCLVFDGLDQCHRLHAHRIASYRFWAGKVPPGA